MLLIPLELVCVRRGRRGIENEIDRAQPSIDSLAEVQPLVGGDWRQSRVHMPTMCERTERELRVLSEELNKILSVIHRAKYDVTKAKKAVEARPVSLADYVCRLESIDKYGKLHGIDVTARLDDAQAEWVLYESQKTPEEQTWVWKDAAKAFVIDLATEAGRLAAEHGIKWAKSRTKATDDPKKKETPCREST